MILGLLDHDAGAVDPLSLQLLAAGQALAAEYGATFEVVAVGEPARALAPLLGRHGVRRLRLVTAPGADGYLAAVWAGAVLDVVRAVGATLVLGPGTDRSHEVLAGAAARAEAPLAANCTAIVPGSPCRVTRLRWAGSLLEEAELTGPLSFATLAPHAFAAAPPQAEAPQPEVVEHAYAVPERDLRVRLRTRTESSQGISLAEAAVVVAGGRGVDGEFGALEELAALLGGRVGASRVATSLGWRPHADQVGQTGTRIAPDLYIACGISGAIQHMAGCRSAKRILAVNTDPEAPIMRLADYVVVGDVHAVLPALVASVRGARAPAV
jgi:electron transfer flavoprotein alpha subunit